MKQFRVLILAAILGTAAMHSTAQVTVIDSGYCGAAGDGSNLTWKFTSDSVLTISGSGNMKDFAPYAPWHSYYNQIQTLIIGDSVETIGDYAFLSCMNLKHITIPEGVTNIGNAAFSTCTNLSTITIPEGVTSIGTSAFFYCNLTSITLPNSVMNLGNRVFGRCNNLTSINVESENDNYTSVDGVLFNKAMTILICCPAGKTGTYVMPNDVTNIRDNAFEECKKLTSITISNDVTDIGNDAFSGCEILDSIIIPNSVKNIGNYAFCNCNSLTSIILSNSITSIGIATFGYCRSLTSITIPNGVTSIGNNAFSCCDSLTTIIFPNSLTTIDINAFVFCRRLTSIICKAVNPPILAINAFLYAPNTIPVYIPCGSVPNYKTNWTYFSNFIGFTDTSFIYDAVCFGKTYNDNGFNISNGTGIYYRTEITVQDCESIICLTLTEYPQTPITTYSDTIHYGETYNDANFANLTQAGTYYDTLQNTNGCDSIIELTLTVTGVGIAEPNYELQITNYEVYDIFGRLLLSSPSLPSLQQSLPSLQQPLKSYQSLPSLEALPQGIYILRMQTTQGTITKKLIIH